MLLAKEFSQVSFLSLLHLTIPHGVLTFSDVFSITQHLYHPLSHTHIYLPPKLFDSSAKERGGFCLIVNFSKNVLTSTRANANVIFNAGKIISPYLSSFCEKQCSSLTFQGRLKISNRMKNKRAFSRKNQVIKPSS